MERRDILKASALFLGYAVTGGTALAVLNGCKADTSATWNPDTFTTDQSDLLAELAERIIPTTDTPGAKDALVHRYIDEAVKSNYSEEEKTSFMEGLQRIESMSDEKYGKSFVKISDEEKDTILQELADESKTAEGSHIFTTLKNLIVTGYFTSEVGAKQALIFDPVPGPYKGCIDFSEVKGVYAL